MFTISSVPALKLVHVHLSGFLALQDVAELSRQEQAHVAAMGCGDDQFLLLIDASGSVIQSQEVVAAFQDIVANSPRKARRIAVVRGNSLTGQQTERILRVRDDAAVFYSLEEAEAWLFKAWAEAA